MKTMYSFLRNVVAFYVEGFQTMTWGRTLWIIIVLKLVILFAVLRPFFFQPALQGSEKEKAHHSPRPCLHLLRMATN